MSEGEKIIPINIEDEMKSSYIDYSMSVIISRALPDIRDGLKPVHRRVLFGMYQLGLLNNKPYKKSARIVGEVLGKFHPHGDSSVYEAMVRMAQDWSLRYTLIDGQGNYGSIDGDPPAAMRYTEARLKKISNELLSDIEKDTVNFKLNFDDTIEEPVVLPTKLPNLLINGSSGIAVGMATNMPPHNLNEIIDGIILYVDNNNIEIDQLIKIIKGPDFPTGGIIYGFEGVKEYFTTGKGKIILRAKTNLQTINNKKCIIVTEIPYQVNKSDLISKTALLIKEGKISGISEIRDESDRNGLRIVYTLKNDSIPNVILNKLFKFTSLQTTFNVNNIALINGKPDQVNILKLIKEFVNHRHKTVLKRTKFDLKKSLQRQHLLEGYMKVISNQNDLDKAINIIRNAKTPDKAREILIKEFILSELQAKSILELKLRTLTNMEINNIKQEYNELLNKVNNFNNILSDVSLRMNIIKEELIEIKNKYGDERKTQIDYKGGEFNIEDIIPDDKVIVTISQMGYIKRTLLSEYKIQSRGGIGNRAAATRDEDVLEYMITASNHQYILFFTEKGKCFWLRVYEIPEGNKNSKGRAIQNLINIDKNDKVKAHIYTHNLNDDDYVKNHYVLMVTKKGMIKKTSLQAYSKPRTNGINAISIKQGDTLLEALLTDGKSNIMIATKYGKAIKFEDNKIRSIGRTGAGVIGINLGEDNNNEVIGMICIKDPKKETVLVVSEKGYGKRSNILHYRETNRGGKGVTTLNITPKTGNLISIKNVEKEDDIMIINKSGIAIRISLKNIRVMGRATQGVKLINLKNNDNIAAVTKIKKN